MNYEQTRKKVKREFEEKLRVRDERIALLEKQNLELMEELSKLRTSYNDLETEYARWLLCTSISDSEKQLFNSGIPNSKLGNFSPAFDTNLDRLFREVLKGMIR